MYKNHLKIFFSQLLGNKILALINIVGLGASLTCCLLIALFVNHELSYDSFFTNSKNTYRLSHTFIPAEGMEGYFSTVGGAAAGFLEENFPQVVTATRIEQREVSLSHDNVAFNEKQFNLVDKNFFTVFDFQWLHGDKTRAFNVPNAVVLTESTARQYFGSENPIGKSLLMDKEIPLTVTGVIVDLPSNSHMTGRTFVSFYLLNTLGEDPIAYLNDWWGRGFYTYFTLRPETDVNEFINSFKVLIKQAVEFVPGMPDDAVSEYGVISLKDIHMKSHNLDELRPAGNQIVVYTFSAIAIGILFIAIINFINIATARASRRAREVGMRKALGATRKQLIMQFVVEAFLLCGLAMVFALACVELLLPALNGMLDMQLQIARENVLNIGIGLMMVTVMLGLLAGWYPAIHLSAFKPVATLKGLSISGQAGATFRSVLVILQFTVVIILIVAVSVVQSQLRHVSTLDLGFRQDHIVVINDTTSDIADQYEAFRNTLLEHDAISSVSSASSSPIRKIAYSMTVIRSEENSSFKSIPVMGVDDSFFTTYGIKLLAGRNFSNIPISLPENSVGGGPAILNERAAREFGWTPADAIGKNIIPTAGVEVMPNFVIGVVTNTIENARQEANPIIYYPNWGMAGGAISVRIKEGKVAEALAHIDEQWTLFNPESPIQRTFVDDSINALYLQDTRQLKLVIIFSVLAIVIACMGLYGLVAYSAECRTKEIGIRKVVGGSVWQIVLLLTKDFSKLVLISNVIAWPVAYYAMNRWLENFAYRIDLTPLIFIGSGLIALCIAWVTVGSTAAKAARQKPVLALRYE